MEITLPSDAYYELAMKNINLMDFTANPYLEDRFGVVTIDLDRVPYIYTSELSEAFKKHIHDKINKTNEEILSNTNVNSYTTKRLEEDLVHYNNLLKGIDLYIAYRSGSLNQTPKTLKQMFYSLQTLLDTDLKKQKNNWVYRYNSELDYYKPVLFLKSEFSAKKDKNSKDKIYLYFSYIKNNEEQPETCSIDYDDMKRCKRDPKELLLSLNFHFEKEEYLIAYNKVTDDFIKKAIMQNIEFIDENGFRYINDNLHHSSTKRTRFDIDVSSFFTDESKLHKVPIFPSIYCYDLNDYSFKFIDTRRVEPYLYDVDIEKKLILPHDHKNLIDILLSEEYQSHDADFIKGKGNGTLILAMGQAGLGKTLTSEVYAERKKIARLKIHASQLGTDETKIEKKLKEFMALAERWKCILLIDEADVYIRRRDNDVQHNAIVATMLQQIEYFNGILFMTTNRTEDVDEAILSRCGAILKYTLPDKDMFKQLWEIFISQNHLEDKVSKETLETILKEFSSLSGRDVRNIISLVSKYALAHNLQDINFEVFKLCATFRGIYSVGKQG